MKNVQAQKKITETAYKHSPVLSENILELYIQEALDNSLFYMVYQPQIEASTGKLIGMEALIRCELPEAGFISPELFIPVAEKTGKINEIGRWVLNQSCADLTKMKTMGLNNIHIAVNVSAVQLTDKHFLSSLQSVLLKEQIQSTELHLELTETALINEPELALNILKNINNKKIEIWLDDFGTGYSSLSMLRNFPISGFKIDRSFIDRICNDHDDFVLCSTMIVMAQKLGLRVVAEGVENKSQLQTLTQLGCDTLQGYLLGKPVRLEEFISTWC